MSTIEAVHARRIWDSRGRPTVEVEMRLADGSTGRGMAPAGASTGRHEAVEKRDGGARFEGRGVEGALAGIRDEIAPRLQGMDVRDQEGVDDALTTLDGTGNKSRLGGNALIAVSLAAIHAAAAHAREPLWRHLSAGGPVTLPMPEVQIFGGGAHAGYRVDVQDFMVVPTGAATIADAFEIVADVYHAAGRMMEERGLSMGVADEGGYWPAFDSNKAALEALTEAIERSGRRAGEEVAISLDIAASEFAIESDGIFAYKLALEDRSLDSDEMVDLVAGWCDRFPIVSVEDPLDEADDAGLRKFLERVKGRVQVVGDDHLVTDARRVRRAAAAGTVDALLVKPNQAGTVSETHAALRAARDAGMGTIVSARSGETEDVTIAHMAVGWDAGQIKVGSFARSERMAKWNELIRIEEALGDWAVFAGMRAWPGMRAWKETA